MTVPNLDEFDVGNCRVCLDIEQWRRRAARVAFRKADAGAAAAGAGTAAATTDPASLVAKPQATQAAHSDCPLDTEELGRAAWGFLHTTAAYYPVRASAAQQQMALSPQASPHCSPYSSR